MIVPPSTSAEKAQHEGHAVRDRLARMTKGWSEFSESLFQEREHDSATRVSSESVCASLVLYGIWMKTRQGRSVLARLPGLCRSVKEGVCKGLHPLG